MLCCPALRGKGSGASAIRCRLPTHGSNAKLLGQSGDRLPHGLLGLGHGLARTLRGKLLRSLTVLGLTRRVNRRSACNVLSAGGGLLQSASLRPANVQTASHGLAGNVLRRNAGLPQGLLRCPHLTCDRALSGKHVLTANVSKGPCAEGRFREARKSLRGPRVAPRQSRRNVPLSSFNLRANGAKRALVGLHGLLLVRRSPGHDAAELPRRSGQALPGSA